MTYDPLCLAYAVSKLPPGAHLQFDASKHQFAQPSVRQQFTASLVQAILQRLPRAAPEASTALGHTAEAERCRNSGLVKFELC